LSEGENTGHNENSEDVEPEESDDEFREIAERARDEARQKKLEQERRSMTTEGPSRDTPTSGRAGSPVRDTPRYQQPVVSDPVVPIIIMSRLANTNPLVVKRRLRQRLGLVRQYWCERQGFSKDDINRVFLTYNGIKLYDVTSCKALGLDVDEDGNILYKGRREYWGDDEQRIIIEATTEEILEQDRRDRQDEGLHDDMDFSQEADQDLIVEQAPPSTLKVVLKAQGFKDFKLSIKKVCNKTSDLEREGSLTRWSKDTTVAKMLGAFSIHEKIPPDKNMFLIFDGDKIDPEQSAEDLELENMESLEVHFK
jgi:hypothetical protein